jgi:WD40 repeat protein
MRPRSLLLATTALVLAACSGGGARSGPVATTTVATAGAAPAATGTPGPAPEEVTDLAGGVRRFGDGRALFASYDPRTDRTVVATTIGVDVQQGDGAPVVIAPEMATLFAASADGRLVAAVTSAGHLTIWDVASGQAVSTFDVQADEDAALTFAGPDTVLLSDAGSVVRYSTDGTTAPVLTAPSGAQLGSVTVDDAGAVAVPVVTAALSVLTWSATAGPGRMDLGLPAGTRLTGVVWSGDGAHLAVLDAPPTAGDQMAVWDVAAGAFVGTPVDLPNYVTPGQVAFPSPDRVVLPRGDQVVAFDLAGQQQTSFPIGPSAVSQVVAAAGAVVVSRLDGTVTRWSVGAEPTDLGPRTVTLVDLRGGAATTTVDQNGLVRAYGADGNRAHDLSRWAVGETTSVDLTADGAQLALATTTGAVRLLDAATGAVAAVLDRPQGDVSDVSYAPDDTVVATGVAVQKRAEAWDDTIEATRLSSRAQVFKIGGQSEDVAGCSFYEGHVVFSPDGKLLASSSHDFTVQVTPLGDPGATKVLKPHLGTVLDLHFSLDGSKLVTASDDGSMRVWQVDGWKLLGEYRSLPGGYFSLAFSPDGARLAVSGATGQIALVDPTTGAAVATFTGTRAELGDMAFTPDGSRLLAPLPDGAVGIWSVASGQLVGQLTGHTLPVTGIAITHDGARVVTASLDGTVRSWPLPAA